MKNFTRIISFVLVIIAILGVTPVAAFAASNDVEVSFDNDIFDGNYVTTDETIKNGNVNIPENADVIYTSTTDLKYANYYVLKHKCVFKVTDSTKFDKIVTNNLDKDNYVKTKLDVPVIVVWAGSDTSVHSTNEILWSNGVDGFKVGDINVPGNYNYYTLHASTASDTKAHDEAVAARKAAQAKAEAEIADAEAEKSALLRETVNGKISYTVVEILRTPGQWLGADGTDYVFDYARETILSAASKIDYINEDGTYTHNGIIVTDTAGKPLNATNYGAGYAEVLTTIVNGSASEHKGRYGKRVVTLPDFDLTDMYVNNFINRANELMASGKMPTYYPILAVVGNNYANGTAKVVWNNGYSDAAYTIEPVGSYYDPHANKWSFESTYGLPARTTDGYWGETIEDIRQAQIEHGINPDTGKPAETPAPTETPSQTTTSPFVDVKITDYFFPAVMWAVDEGVTNGTSDTTFSPYDPVTRGQAVTFLWRAYGKPSVNSSANFTDVPVGEYYSEAVAWAVENGITNGTSDTTFSPNDSVTYAQMLTFLARANGITIGGDNWEQDAVDWANNVGAATGVGIVNYKPCPRCNVVYFIYKVIVG